MGVYRDLYCPVCRERDSAKLYRSRILNGENYRTPTWLNVEILGPNANGSGIVCRCKNCNYQWESKSGTAKRKLRNLLEFKD